MKSTGNDTRCYIEPDHIGGQIVCRLVHRHKFAPADPLIALDRNQLKVKVLALLEKTPLTSHQVCEKLEKIDGLSLTHRAVEMALMRYWRQGLLKRERIGRRFSYVLTERGRARREWLTKNSS